MFLIKFLIGFLCVATCVKIASFKASKLKEDLYFYDSLIIACDSLLMGISYSKETINKLLNVDYPSESFRLTVKNFLTNNEYLDNENLTLEENLKIKSFFYLLGKSDSKTQKSSVISYKTDFIKVRDELKKRFNKNYSLILKIGFSLGVMLFVLVI